MKLFKAIGWGVIIAVLLSPVITSAQIVVGHLSVSPESIDFGYFAVEDSARAEITITNINGEPLVITTIEIVAADGEDSFSIAAVEPPPPPIIVPDGGGFINFEVLFEPTSYGMHEAKLHIISFEGDVSITLEGTGVADEPSTELMNEIIDFFETANLEGDGPGNSADNRFFAFGQMLYTANDLIASGDFEAACDQLWSAYIHADGENYPSDFITGEHKTDLADKILEIINLLGCP